MWILKKVQKVLGLTAPHHTQFKQILKFINSGVLYKDLHEWSDVKYCKMMKIRIFCIWILLNRHCGIKDPSWSELRHFVWFLNTQLVDFENSAFVSLAAAEDLPGFSQFVLRFLIQMSRVRNFSKCWEWRLYLIFNDFIPSSIVDEITDSRTDVKLSDGKVASYLKYFKT